MGNTEEYRGKAVTIRFDGARCIHSRHCVLEAPKVFRANVAGPWIEPDAATSEELMAVARKCPSGAITYERHDGGPAERPPDVNTVRVLENGPLAVMASLSIAGHGDRLRATLCRCGASNNKPFCDGSHAAAGFKATGEPPVAQSQTLEGRGGPVTVTPAKDGPLLVNGNVEIIAGSGHTIQTAAKCALCRCGHSNNKPFCDGSHKAAGFRAD